MKYFSMFTGVGGFELGIEKANSGGECKPISEESSRSSISPKWNESNNKCRNSRICDWVCVGFSEIDKYASELLKQKFPTVKNYGDATKINTDELPDFDMLCGGYPCQSFSIAGKRKGFADTRGTMFFEIERIAKEKQPRVILLENVKGLLSHDKGNTFKIITQHLNSMGYLVDYRILNSKYFGVPQNRERIFHIGYNIKWMIKEDLEDGQVKRNTQLDKMLKGWVLENLLKDLEELKKLSETNLKGWVLNYLRYICGNQTRLEYLKTIKNSQTNNYQKSLKEHPQQSPIKEENLDTTSKGKENNLKMVQDICEFMMGKEIDSGFIESWQKSILEILEENNQSTTSILIRKIIEKKTFSCAEINLIIGLFILQQNDYWEKWLNQEISDLIKLKEFIQNEGRRNKTKLRERYLLRNIRTSMGFDESLNGQRNFIIGSLRGERRPEILPLGEVYENSNQKDERQLSSTITSTYWKGWGGGRQMISQAHRVRDTNGVSQTLQGQAGGQGEKTGLYQIAPSLHGFEHGTHKHFNEILPKRGLRIRRLTPRECNFLQGFPKDWDRWGVSFINLETYNKGNGNAEKTNTNKILSSLQKAVKEGEVQERRIDELIALLKEEVLQPKMYAIELQEQMEKGGGVRTTRELSCKTIDYCDKLLNLWETEKLRYSPQRQEQIEQLIGKLTSSLQKLSYEVTSERGWLEQAQSFKEGERFFGKIRLMSDTQRYKMMGNAVTVNVVGAIINKMFLKDFKNE
jgi:DNA-cytosine methyltransferase